MGNRNEISCRNSPKKPAERVFYNFRQRMRGSLSGTRCLTKTRSSLERAAAITFLLRFVFSIGHIDPTPSRLMENVIVGSEGNFSLPINFIRAA